jgi:hypothetical protein
MYDDVNRLFLVDLWLLRGSTQFLQFLHGSSSEEVREVRVHIFFKVYNQY